jgi:hypothetical protein
MRKDNQVCWQGTCEGILEEVHHWINSSTTSESERIFWLTGPAMSCKSTIARTVAQHFQQLGRLGSMICHDASTKPLSPDLIVPTIASDLAMLDDNWKESLRSRQSTIPEARFEHLLLKQAEHVETVGPILIVIDVLDDADSRARPDLLRIIHRLTELPTNFRLLVVSRMEGDVISTLGTIPLVLHRDIGMDSFEGMDRDISRFVAGRLSQFSELEARWPGKQWLSLLVAASDRCFLWADIAVRFIEGRGGQGIDASDRCSRLSCCLDCAARCPMMARPDKVDALCKATLGYIHATRFYGVSRDVFSSIMAAVFTQGEYPTAEVLAQFGYTGEEQTLLPRVIACIGYLLRSAPMVAASLRPVHPSIRRLFAFPVQHFHYAHVCFNILRNGLTFNMGRVTSSYVRNNDMSISADSFTDITTPLCYACRHWVTHLSQAVLTGSLLDKARYFFENKFLYWLEVMSLLNEIDVALEQLRSFEQLMEVIYYMLNIIDLSDHSDRAATLNLLRNFGRALNVFCELSPSQFDKASLISIFPHCRCGYLIWIRKAVGQASQRRTFVDLGTLSGCQASARTITGAP